MENLYIPPYIIFLDFRARLFHDFPPPAGIKRDIVLVMGTYLMQVLRCKAKLRHGKGSFLSLKMEINEITSTAPEADYRSRHLKMAGP